MKVDFTDNYTLEITPENYAEEIALRAWMTMGDVVIGSCGHGMLSINDYKESEADDE